MSTKYIDPITDFGFKKLFGEEESKPVLKRFLFDILELPSPIAEITFSPTEKLPRTPQERKGIFDVYCKDESGREFIVEMQKATHDFVLAQKSRQLHFRDRALYYSTFPINQQAERGDWDYSLNAVYFVGILDFTFHDDNRYLRRIQLMDCETHEIFSQKLTFVYIELPKFNLTLEQLKISLEKWIYFIKHATDFSQVPDNLREEPFPLAFHLAERSQMNEIEAYYYEGSLKEKRDHYAETETARIEGREEKTLEIAQAMIEQQIPLETIRQITGLTEEQIKNIAEKLT